MNLVFNFSLLGNFLIFLLSGLFCFSLAVYIYTKITPYNEFKLIQEGNISAALSLGGTSIGIALPIVSLLSHAVNILDVFIWVGLAVLIQLLAWVVINKLIFKSLSADIIADKKSVGLSVGFLSLCVGLINYASLTY